MIKLFRYLSYTFCFSGQPYYGRLFSRFINPVISLSIGMWLSFLTHVFFKEQVGDYARLVIIIGLPLSFYFHYRWSKMLRETTKKQLRQEFPGISKENRWSNFAFGLFLAFLPLLSLIFTIWKLAPD